MVMSRSQMPIQRVREDWVVPVRSSSPCGRRDPEVTGDGSQGAPGSHISRTVSRHPLPWVTLPICCDKTLPPSTRHSRCILETMAASLPLLPCVHSTHCAWMTSSLGSETEHGKDSQGPVPGVLTVTSPLPCTLRASPAFLHTPRAAGGWE